MVNCEANRAVLLLVGAVAREEELAMKARCTHGAPWFADCPWCEAEKTPIYTPRQLACLRMCEELMDRALESYDEWSRVLCPERSEGPQNSSIP